MRFITGDLDAMPGSQKKAVIDGKELHPNAKISAEVWNLWEALPTQTLPQRGARPVKRLVALAQALSTDMVHPGALKKVEQEMHQILDGYGTRYKDKLENAIKEVWAVHVQQIEGRFGMTGLTYSQFVERADDRAIRSGFEAAKKAFGADIAQSYVNHLAGPDNDDSDDDGLREAFVRTAALATIKDIRDKVDQEALELTNKMFVEFRVAIKQLSDVRQQVYEDIRAMATEPQKGILRSPRTRVEGFSIEEEGEIIPAPLAELHLMSDERGLFPITSLNSWEYKIFLAELGRGNLKAWYRNPSRAAFDSLGITYRDDKTGNWRSMHPDFVFFHEVNGKIVPSILDPHGHHLEDALMKLKALANFAQVYGDVFHRIEALAEIDREMKVIDMKKKSVREQLLVTKQSAEEVYRSKLAVNYSD